MWWLAIGGVLGVMTTVVVRACDEETEYVMTAKQVERHENALARRRQPA
jgi:hypothetical protein